LCFCRYAPPVFRIGEISHSRLFLLLAGWLRSRDRITKGMLATSGAIIQIARLYLGYNPIEYTMGAS
jgi:hypothetical protein